MRTAKAEVFIIWTNAYPDASGLMMIHGEPLPVSEATALAFRLNAKALATKAHYRFIAQPYE